jgi:hypothetical protein
MTHVIMVEYVFDTPLDSSENQRLAEKLGPCLMVHEATWIRSYLSLDRKKLVSVFEAIDAGSVRYAHNSAGIKFASIWPAELSATHGG